MIAELGLPLCNTHRGRGVWPFFLPLVVPHGPGQWHYLGEDWAFSHRLAEIGVVPLADTTIRLWHWGRYGFSWEDAGSDVNAFALTTIALGRDPPPGRSKGRKGEYGLSTACRFPGNQLAERPCG